MKIEGLEATYLTGGMSPVQSSVLTSNSRYLNNPRFRDVFAQEALKRNGSDLPDAYLIPEINRAVAEEMDVARLYQLLDVARTAKPEFADWLDARFLSNWAETDLSGCADGTVGAMIRAFIADSGMDIDFLFKELPQDDFGYLLKRRVQNHDIEHMITGFDTTQVGEISLIVANAIAVSNYFDPELAQMLSLQPLFLASATLMRFNCHYPAAMPALLEGFAMAHAVGEQQRYPLFMIRWEDHIDKPVEQVRAELGFTAGPLPSSGHWDWTTPLSHG